MSMNETNLNSMSAFYTDLNIKVTFYFTIISSGIGLPINIISGWIFFRIMKKNNSTNMGLLCLIQSIVDTIYVLLLLFVLRTSPILFTHNFYNSSDFSCKILMFMRRFVGHASCAVTVIITLDRFIAVCYPNLASYMKRKSFLFGLTFGSFLFMIAIDTVNLFFYLPNKLNSSCIADSNVGISSDMIQIIFRTYLPFAVMSVMNYFIIKKMRKSSRVKVKRTSQSRKENHFTYAVIAYDGFFLLCSLPLAIYFIIYDAFLYSNTLKSDPVMNSVFVFVLNIVLDISYLKNYFTFFLNLFFNKIFWNETKSILNNNVSIASSSLPPLKTTI